MMLAQWPSHFSSEIIREAFGPRVAGYTIALEAWRRGLRIRFFDSHLRKYQISDGQRSISFDKSRPSLTTKKAVSIEQDKYKTASHLRAAGVPVPPHELVDPHVSDAESVLTAAADAIGYPVVLKPLRGSMGRDVYTNIATAEDLLETFHAMRQGAHDGAQFILEQHFEGEDYRVLVVGERAVAACLKRPAHVVGDGVHTVKELIATKNAARLHNPYLCEKPIVVDREVTAYLKRLGHTIADVPQAHQHVRLRGKANVSQGGDNADKTDSIPEALKEAAVKAVAAVPGLAIAGVDVLYDPARAATDSFRVIELNSRPEIELNMYMWEGEGQDAPRHIIDVFFPESQRPADPGIATLGLNLEQLLAPLRGASAEEVLVKRKPAHHYPVRTVYGHGHGQPFSAKERNAIHLAARRAGISGQCTGSAEGQSIVVCGTGEQVERFLRLVPKTLKLDKGSARPWGGPVTQGFHFCG